MINNNIVKIIISKKEQKKFYKILKKINKIANKYTSYMAIDFEFNSKKIALMQILFQIQKNNKIINKYYIIYPPIIHTKILNYLKINIMSNLNILKILHGSESLDIPYIVEELYNYDTENLIDFFLSIVDTRYLCEYLNLRNNRPNICRIYDLLLNYNVIDNKCKHT
jgi:hypothetical protein